MLSGRKKRKKKNSPWKAASQHSREDFFLFLSFHWIFLYSFFSGTQKAIFPSPFLSVAKNPLPSHPALQHRCTWVRGERRGLHAALPEMSPSLHFSSKQELPSKKSKDLAFFSHKQNIFVQCPHEAAMVGMLHHITRKWLFLDAVKLDVFLLPLCHTQTEKISLTLLLDPV